MSLFTTIQILFLIVFAAFVLFTVLCCHSEYLLYRSSQVQQKAMEHWLADDEEDDQETPENPILDYSQLPSSGI